MENNIYGDTFKLNMKMRKFKNTEEALSIFVENAIIYGETTMNGDYRKCNGSYNKIMKCFSYMEKCDCILTLSQFLHHNDISVRLWAAYALLFFSPVEAAATLKHLSHNAGIMANDARVLLDEFKAGNISKTF